MTPPLEAAMFCGRNHMAACQIIPVSEKNTPPEKKTLGKPSLKNTKSGTGEEFLLLFCKA